MNEELNVGMKCIKYMLFVANFMFVLIGFLLISIGSGIKTLYADFDLFMANHYFSPAHLAVAIGIIIFFVSLFGCIGAFKESTCLVSLYTVMLIIILILEIAASIAAYAMRTNIIEVLTNNMQVSIHEYYSIEYVRDSWDFMQSHLYCCGIDGPDDWYNRDDRIAPKHPMPPLEPEDPTEPVDQTDGNSTWSGPTSCCKDFYNGQCTVLWGMGCRDKLSYVISETALLLGCGALAVAFVQFLGIVFAHMLSKAIRRLKTQRLVEEMQNRQTIYEQMARSDQEKQTTPVVYTPNDSSDA